MSVPQAETYDPGGDDHPAMKRLRWELRSTLCQLRSRRGSRVSEPCARARLLASQLSEATSVAFNLYRHGRHQLEMNLCCAVPVELRTARQLGP